MAEEVKVKPRRGRPPKALIAEKKKPGKVGRPVGETGRIQELKARLLSTTGDRVINKIVEIAMTDNHPVQGAALKMCLDRILPLSYFEKAKDSGSVPQISINITSIGEPKIEQAEVIDNINVTDVQFKDE